MNAFNCSLQCVLLWGTTVHKMFISFKSPEPNVIAHNLILTTTISAASHRHPLSLIWPWCIAVRFNFARDEAMAGERAGANTKERTAIMLSYISISRKKHSQHNFLKTSNKNTCKPRWCKRPVYRRCRPGCVCSTTVLPRHTFCLNSGAKWLYAI